MAIVLSVPDDSGQRHLILDAEAELEIERIVADVTVAGIQQCHLILLSLFYFSFFNTLQ